METILPERKPNRLVNFDYSTEGAYFITVCTHHRRKILSHIRVGAIYPKGTSVGRTNRPQCD